MDGAFNRVIPLLRSEGNKREEVQGRIDGYEAMYNHGTDDDRSTAYMQQVNTYFDLATPFYEYAWGQSFHFALQYKGERYDAAIARYEHSMALKMGAKKGMRILDVGCGVGGPARSIARISGATIIGINNNNYQINRARKLTQEAGLSNLVSFVQTDFHHAGEKFEKESFDAIFTIEATAHSPKKLQVYTGLYSLLKPGGIMVAGEWALTPKYDPSNKKHVEWIKKIERGSALPPLESDQVVLGYFKKAGFEVIEARDHAKDAAPEFPWYHPFEFSLTPQGILRTRLGHYFTHYMVKFMETVKLAAPGTTDVSRVLMEASEGLLQSGRLEILTPMYILVGRKPE